MNLVWLCQWVLLFGLVSIGLSAIDCPDGGVFLSPQGNDTHGNGTQGAPFESFERGFEYFHQKGIRKAVLCLFPGAYSTLQSDYSIGPFDSAVVVPADRTDLPLPVLERAHYTVQSTTNFQIGYMKMNDVTIKSWKTNMYIHDIYSDNSRSSLYFFPQTDSNSLQIERMFGMELKLFVERGVILSSVTIHESNLKSTFLSNFNNATITNSFLQSYLIVYAQSVISVINCTVSGLHFTLDKDLHNYFISLSPVEPERPLIVNFIANHFINNTIYEEDTTRLIQVNGDTYTLNYENNYFSCNYGFATSSNVSYPLPLLPAPLSAQVTANIVGNVVDQTCPYTCSPGQAPIYQGMSCAACPSNFASPDGKECVPCPPGTDLPKGATNCTQCPEGKFNPSPNSTCQTCGSGITQNATICESCPFSYYPEKTLCKPCGKYDYITHTQCPQCTFFQEPPNCSQFSRDATVLLGAFCGGMVLVICLSRVSHRQKSSYQRIMD